MKNPSSEVEWPQIVRINMVYLIRLFVGSLDLFHSRCKAYGGDT